VFVTLRSACPAPATAMFTVAELSVTFVSRVGVAAVAVSVMIVPAAVPALTLYTAVIVPVEPGAHLDCAIHRSRIRTGPRPSATRDNQY